VGNKKKTGGTHAAKAIDETREKSGICVSRAKTISLPQEVHEKKIRGGEHADNGLVKKRAGTYRWSRSSGTPWHHTESGQRKSG